MNDLTPIFLRTLAGKCHWSNEITWRVLSSLASTLPGASVDWEQGDEDWGRVIRGREAIAYVHADWPLVVVLSELEDYVKKLSAEWSFEIIVAPTFFDEIFRVDKAVLERLCSRAVSNNIDYERISINDMWWATI